MSKNLAAYFKIYGGELLKGQYVLLNSLKVTRPWVDFEKVKKYAAYSGDPVPIEMIVTNQSFYIIGGHHRSVANLCRGGSDTLADLLISSKPKLARRIARRDCGYLIDISAKLPDGGLICPYGILDR